MTITIEINEEDYRDLVDWYAQAIDQVERTLAPMMGKPLIAVQSIQDAALMKDVVAALETLRHQRTIVETFNHQVS